MHKHASTLMASQQLEGRTFELFRRRFKVMRARRWAAG